MGLTNGEIMGPASTEKVKIVYREKPSSGAAVGVVSIAFSLVAIFTPLAVLCLPLAIILMLASLVRGIISLSLLGISTAVLATVFVAIGYATSPVALASLLALLGRLQ